MTHDTTTSAVIEEAAHSIANILLPVLNDQNDLKWQAGDILANGVAAHREDEADIFAAVSRLLTRHGREVKERSLQSYAATARAFPEAERGHNVSFSVYRAVAESAPESAPTMMVTMLEAFKKNGLTASQRSALEFFGRNKGGGVSEKGVVDYITRHPEVVTRAVQDSPAVAEAARAGLTEPLPESPLLPPRPWGPPPNGSLTRIASMESGLRALHRSLPYLHDEADLDEALVRIQGLIDGLQECVGRAGTARLVA